MPVYYLRLSELTEKTEYVENQKECHCSFGNVLYDMRFFLYHPTSYLLRVLRCAG